MKRVLLMVAIVVMLASSVWAQKPKAQESAYGSCGLPSEMIGKKHLDDVCKTWHSNVPVEGTAFCMGKECFVPKNGDHITVTAADNLGAFPKTWLAHVKKGTLVDTYPGDKCVLGKSGEKTRIEIPATNTTPRCKTERVVDNYLYHEHFAANDKTKCLAWIECREPLPATTATK